MKVSELEGAELDFYVAKANGWEKLLVCDPLHPTDEFYNYVDSKTGAGQHPYGSWNPSTDPAQGWPIIENHIFGLEKMGAVSPTDVAWKAVAVYDDDWITQEGPTSLIAAMRAYVASKLGSEV